MIATFRDDWLREFVQNDARPKQLPADLERVLFRKLQLIDDANDDRDLRVPPGNHFEKLQVNLKGYCSIRVNKRWRLIFAWNTERGEASGIYLDDHSYQ
jgi:proteic killer suppression protein